MGASGMEQYALVIDAGSTGSRIHCFRFLKGKEGEIDLQNDSFMQLKPGLSSYASEPEKGARSLVPLIDKCLAEVPKHLQKRTPIQVRATAGLRLLPGTQAEMLLQEVRKLLKTYPFSFQTDSVSIMDGADEGAFSWITLNYLLGNLDKPLEDTVASIDLGGGSVQLAHAVDEETARRAPAGYIHTMQVGKRKFNIYVHSYLGYGLMAGRAEVLEEKMDGMGHPCILKGYSGSYSYGSETFQVVSMDDGPSFETCHSTAVNALKSGTPCGVVQQHECSFNGAWGGGRGPGARTFYVSSYFFDRAVESGIVADESTSSILVKPRSFEAAAREVCNKANHEVRTIFPRVEEEQAPYFCLDLSYQYSLLTNGFGIDADNDIVLVKRIEYKGDYVEAAWSLGAALNSLTSTR